MNIKRLIMILVGVMLIGFGVGFYSLIYNDEFSLSKINFGNIDVRSNGSDVKIGPDGIEVKDGDDHVIIDWNGIKVTDGDDIVIVGLDGINVKDGITNNNWNWNIGNWFSFGPKNLVVSNVNEEKFENIAGIDSINISSSFIDIKVTTENRDDVRIKYYGKMKSNVVPNLEIASNKNILNIDLNNSETNNYTVTESNVVLEVFIPQNFEGSFNIESSSSDIFLKDISGKKLDVSTSSGDINLANIKGENYVLLTSSGDILGKEILGDVTANSSSGDMDFILDESTGNYDLASSSGDINIDYSQGASYKGTVNSSSGEMEYNGSINIVKNNKNSYELTIGSEKNRIKINTSSGDIRFESR